MIYSTRSNHSRGRPSKRYYQSASAIKVCRHGRRAWNYCVSFRASFGAIFVPELKAVAPKKSKNQVNFSCNPMMCSSHDIIKRIDEGLRCEEVWKQCCFSIFRWNSGLNLMIWWWLRSDGGPHILMCVRNGPILRCMSQGLYYWCVWWMLPVLFLRKIHYIRMHQQVKANFIHSAQLLCCLSLFLQRMHPPHLAASKTIVDRYVPTVKSGVITLDVGVAFARELIDVVHLKWHKILLSWDHLFLFHSGEMGYKATYSCSSEYSRQDMTRNGSNLMSGGDERFVLSNRQMNE